MSGLWNAPEAKASDIGEERVARARALAPAIEGVTVKTGERMFGDVTLLGVLESEVRRLEASLTRV